MSATKTERRSLRYIRLAAYLAAIPPETPSIKLSLPDVEELVGSNLPESARYPSWWRNDPHRMHSRAWLTAGWKVERVDAEELSVTWVREEVDEIRL